MRLAFLVGVGATLGLVSTGFAQSFSTPVNGAGWDQDLYELPSGEYVQVLRGSTEITLGGRTFGRPYGDLVAHRVVKDANGVVQQLIRLEPSDVPPGAQPGVVGNRLYTREQVTATFVVRRAANGSVLQVQRFRHGDRDADMSSRLLPDGSLLLFGNYHPYDLTVGLVARAGAEGGVRWAHELPVDPRSGCDEDHQLCAFSDLHHALLVGGEAILSGSFKPGRLRVGGRTIVGRRSLNSVSMKVNLESGEVGWALNRRERTVSPIVADGRPLTVAGIGRRARLVAIDLSTGRLRPHRQLRGLEGEPEQVVPFGAGVAVFSMSDNRREHWVQGFDGSGSRTFHHRGLNFQSELLSDSGSLIVASPDLDQLAYPHVAGFQVERLSVTGEVLERVHHSGVWQTARTILHPRAERGAFLSSHIVSTSGTHLAARDAFSPVAPPPAPRVQTRAEAQAPVQNPFNAF
ncbi:MAG: hypothetical protein AAGE52_08975 [Myxococcota bacterium]